ncbi:MAG: malonic semialdehyde reductase [Alphaproteobacteria bacterium]|nr:malonic semialdehyde reductase [Alphaproteobacteria bacterium]
MPKPLPDISLDQLFRTARTHRSWTEESVPDVLVQAVYEMLRMAPTSGNCSPARFLFLKSREAKARLEPLLDEGNRKQTMSAPWTVVVAYDLAFARFMPKLAPHAKGAEHWFDGEETTKFHAFQSGTLGGAYLIVAARALGLDCGPMNGFDHAGIDREFFASDPAMKTWRANFLCNLGYGDGARIHPRAPRLDFEEACRIL